MYDRRFLPLDHRFQDSKSFNGKVDKRKRPKLPSDAQILAQVDVLEGIKFEKLVSMPKRDYKFKKEHLSPTSILSSHLLHHNLEVMHIEKNCVQQYSWTFAGHCG